jgi:transposase InsO family protein
VNLASLSKFLNKGAILHGEGKVLQLQIQGETFLRAENEDDLMVIQTIQPRSRAFVISEAEQPELWHMRFCHAGWETLARMAQDNLVDGLPVSAERFRKAGKTVCEPCVLGKQIRKPFPASSRESSGPFDLIHTDVCGPMQTKTPGGNRYFVSFIDDYSRCAVIQLLENKNQVKTALSAFVSTMETQFDKKIKTLRSDRGGEFWNKEMQSFCASKGIVHQKTNPYSSQENGVAERLNRTLMEKARAMLQGSSLSDEYWGEAVLTASYVRNRTVSQVSPREDAP